MPQRFDFDQYLRDYHRLTPLERDAVVRQVLRDARVDRAEAMKVLLRAGLALAGKALRYGVRILRTAVVGTGAFVGAAWCRYDRARRRRATAAQLYAMDDRELKDIGLRRGDIGYVLSGRSDPTRHPRTARRMPEVAGARDYSSPSLQPPQRPGAPLLLRKECA